MVRRRGLILVAIALTIGLLVSPHTYSAPSRRLIVAIGQEPNSLDPSLAFISADFVAVENWTEYLIYKAPSGDLKPGLATSWKISTDGKVIEFRLRKGVKFQSGDNLTAKDVEFSFDRGQKKNSTVKTRLSRVDRFEIIDDYYFKIHLKAPDPALIPSRGGAAIVSKSYYDRVGEDEFVKRPLGTPAPYKVVRYVPGEYVDIERFEDYWGEKPSVKEARFYFVTEDLTRVAKLKAGEVDIINNCPYPSVREIEGSPKLKIIKFPGNHPTPSIVFSTRNPNVPWHDRRVRLAMAHAFDCDTIIKTILFGIPNHWAFLAPHELGYDPNLKPYPYDPKKAKELLAEAGYPNGFEFTLYWEATGAMPMGRETVEALASYLEAVGIRPKLVAEESLASMSRLRASKSPKAEHVSFRRPGRAGGTEPSYYLDLFYGAEGGFSVYYNEELEKVIKEARATADDTKRGELIKKGVKIICDDVATIPIYNMVPVYAMKKDIDFNPTLKNPFDLILVKDVSMR